MGWSMGRGGGQGVEHWGRAYGGCSGSLEADVLLTFTFNNKISDYFQCLQMPSLVGLFKYHTCSRSRPLIKCFKVYTSKFNICA